ncbi:MAG: GGDEF domain-containing protein [Bacillota bacterium]
MDRLLESYGTGRSLRTLVKYLTLTAVVGLSTAYAILHGASFPDVGTVLLYAILGLAGHHLVVAFPGGQFISLDDPVTFAALWCFGAPVAILTSVPASLIQFFTRKRGLLNVLFNAGQLTLSTVAAGTAASILRGFVTRGGQVAEVLVVMATVAVFDLANNGFVSLAISIDQEQPWDAVFRRIALVDRRNSVVLWYFVNIAGVLLSTYMGKAGTLFVFIGILALWAQMQFEREAARKAQEAQTDVLTGLFNTRYLEDWMGSEFPKIAAQDESECSLVFVDVDGLKQVNDTYGHEAGDGVLVHLGKILRSVTRAKDRVVRYGGDEFILICQDAGVDEATAIGQRILEAIKKDPLVYDGHQVNYGVSMGVASFPKHSMSSRDLVRMADKAMYLAKKEGGNMVYTADSL